ncbi:MAG: hypothetical protein LBB23_03635 [Rickettsiales bacterium]|nr:hypothetical protein [Rickettsiales bacterium]
MDYQTFFVLFIFNPYYQINYEISINKYSVIIDHYPVRLRRPPLRQRRGLYLSINMELGAAISAVGNKF